MRSNFQNDSTKQNFMIPTNFCRCFKGILLRNNPNKWVFKTSNISKVHIPSWLLWTTALIDSLTFDVFLCEVPRDPKMSCKLERNTTIIWLLFEWEEICNLITNELIDLFPLGNWFCKLLDNSCNDTKYFHWIDAGLNKCYQNRLSSAVVVGQ